MPADLRPWALGTQGWRAQKPPRGHDVFVFGHEMLKDGEVDVQECAWFWVSQSSGGEARRERITDFLSSHAWRGASIRRNSKSWRQVASDRDICDI